ncbi:hypothetical protein M2138_002120 [Dysgonomonadaceae bacterium PH5-43]|nr:hypothetical protein [Dysgonomonadaceae bacterium PH5-43]
MTNELTSIQQLIAVSTAIIETPSLSVRDFGIEQEKKSNKLIWSGVVTAAVFGTYAGLAETIASSACVGTSVMITSSALTGIGLAALAGVGAAAAGAGAVPIIGWPAAVLIATYGINKYRKAKKEELEKERMYREIIKKQQAAINKQKNKVTELETLLRDKEATNNQNTKRIKDLEQQIANLAEIFEILTMQSNNFKAA